MSSESKTHIASQVCMLTSPSAVVYTLYTYSFQLLDAKSVARTFLDKKTPEVLEVVNSIIEIFLAPKILSLATATFFYVDSPACSTWRDAARGSGCQAKVTPICPRISKNQMISLAFYIELTATSTKRPRIAASSFGFIDEAEVSLQNILDVI